MSFQSDPKASPGDFFDLLERSGYRWHAKIDSLHVQSDITVTQGTTVLAFHFKGGVIVAGDRRATAGNSIMYEHCDKVIPIDDYSLMAIAGVPATAFEMARVLTHNFEFFRRSQMQSMSGEGKIRALSRLLKENVGMAVQGLGGVSPIFATYDLQARKPSIHFYDMLGADFQIRTHTATGSGSPTIRGILEYEDLWGEKPLAERSESTAVTLAIRLLQTVVPKSKGSMGRTGTAPAREKRIARKPKTRSIIESKKRPLPESDIGTIKTVAKKKPTTSAATPKAGTGSVLALLDGFAPEKFASLDTESLENSDDDEPVSLDTTEVKYASYFARIKHQIERVWIYPSDAAKRGISGDLNLTFSISKDGNLLGARLLDRSGYEILDMAALKAVKEAAPFYPFPATIQREKLTIQANFIYTPNLETIAP